MAKKTAAGGKTPKAAKTRKSKQPALPTMEDRAIQELHDAADALLDAQAATAAAKTDETDAARALVAAMHTHNKVRYAFQGLEIVLKPKKTTDEKVTVKKAKIE